MTTFDSTTWLFIAIFAGIIAAIAVVVWPRALTRGIDWQSEIDREHKTLDELERLP